MSRLEKLLLALTAVIVAAAALWAAITGLGGGDGASQAVPSPPTPSPSPPSPTNPTPTTTSPSESPEESPEPSLGQVQYLADDTVFTATGSLNMVNGPASVNGQPYSNSLGLYAYSPGDVFATFVLGRNYQRFNAVVGLSDDSSSNFTARVKIELDNEVVFEQDMRKGQAEQVELSVDGIYEITFTATYLGAGEGTVVFGDAAVQ